jgi:hypothetical protein
MKSRRVLSRLIMCSMLGGLMWGMKAEGPPTVEFTPGGAADAKVIFRPAGPSENARPFLRLLPPAPGPIPLQAVVKPAP